MIAPIVSESQTLEFPRETQTKLRLKEKQVTRLRKTARKLALLLRSG